MRMVCNAVSHRLPLLHTSSSALPPSSFSSPDCPPDNLLPKATASVGLTYGTPLRDYQGFIACLLVS